MGIKLNFKTKLNNTEHSQDLQRRHKSWLLLFMFICTLILTTTFVLFKDKLLFAESSIEVTDRNKYSSQTVKNGELSFAVTSSVAVKVDKGGIKTVSPVSGTGYQFMFDTGYSMLLISFQDKEIYTVGDSLEQSIKGVYPAGTQLLSGYTVSTGFEQLGYRDNLNWANMGKIYAEYGTLGLTGVNGENKHSLIENIISTDFADSTIDKTNVELLNGLAYRSNVITESLISRSLLYVPRYAVTYDETLKQSASGWKINQDNGGTVNYFNLTSYAPMLAPFTPALINKQIAIGHSKGFRQGTSNDTYTIDGLTYQNNWKGLATAMQTAFKKDATYATKKTAAQHLANAVAYAWPLMLNYDSSKDGNTQYYGPMANIRPNGVEYKVVNVQYINPNINLGTTDAKKYWTSPFVSNAYYIEDTLHSGSARDTNFIENTAKTLDSDKTLSKYKTEVLNEDKLHEDLMNYYKEHPDMAYSVIDAVFGNIKEDTLILPGNFQFYPGYISAMQFVPHPEAYTESINLEERLKNWLKAGINNYDKNDVNCEMRVAGIRQAELNCALGYIITERHGLQNVDTQSNIEIRLVNVYSNQGQIKYTELDKPENAKAKETLAGYKKALAEKGWGAWDLILGFPNNAYCTTFETIASNYFDYDTLSSNKTKVTTLASSALMYAKNHKFVMPTTDNKTLTVGGTTSQDAVISAIYALGKRKTYLGENWRPTETVALGADFAYQKNPGMNDTKEHANLVVMDNLRQAYLCTIYARTQDDTGKRDQSFNYRGMLNVGFNRETTMSQTAFTGFYRQGAGVVAYINPDSVASPYNWKFADDSRKIGLSKYAISFKNFQPGESNLAYTELFNFNNKKIKLTSSKMGNEKITDASDKQKVMWEDSQPYVSAAGSFVLRQAHSYNDKNYLIKPTETGYKIETAGTVRTQTVNGKTAYYYNADRLSTNNIAANNVFKMSFETYSPSADTIAKLNEKEETLIDKTQQNSNVCANGNFFFLYNHNFYKKSDSLEIQAVLGFRETKSKELKVVHNCAPADVSKYNLVLGINFSKEALEALSDSLTDNESITAELNIALGGYDGFLAYYNIDSTTTVEQSKFDTTVLTEKPIFANSFGQLKAAGAGMLYSEAVTNFVQKGYYNTWTNRKDGYTTAKLPNNSDDDKGLVITKTITKKQVDEWLKDDRIADDPTFHNSDTEFLFVVQEWPAEVFAGQDGSKLSTVDSVEKLALNKDYTFGVECQLNILEYVEDAGNDMPSKVTVFGSDTIAEDKVHYTNVGSGLYSGLYGSAGKTAAPTTNEIISRYNTKTVAKAPKTVNDHLKNNREYGEGADNHVYFRFEDSEVKQWKFTGKASLHWVNSEDAKLVSVTWPEDQDAPKLGDTITSTMNINFKGGKTTVKDFYTVLKDEDIKYIIVSIGENKKDTEASYDPIPKDSSSGSLLKTDTLSNLKEGSTGMTDALQKFTNGSVVYTLDEFIALLGGSDSENTSGSLQIKDKYVNTYTAGLTANDPDDILDTAPAMGNQFDANRLEFSFIASIYAAGEHAVLEEASKVKDLSQVLTTVYNDTSVPFLEITNGLGYIINPMTTTTIANKSNARYEAAVARELTNVRIESGNNKLPVEETFFYEYVLNSMNEITVWTPESNKQGAGYRLKNAAELEGNGIRNRDSSGSYASLGDDKKSKGDAWVAAICSPKQVPKEEPAVYVIRTSSPIAYAQVKNGSWTNTSVSRQEWNTLTGIPSTETFYITSGGSEFIIEMTAVELIEEQAYRSYISHFASNDCKFKPGDIASAGGGSVTSVNKADISHELNVTSSVGTITDYFNLPEPTGYTTANFRVSQHGNNTITAYWTGTIANTTANPGMTNHVPYIDNIAASGDYDLGHPGQMTETGQELEAGSYSWNVTPYNTALQQARDWAKQMEDYSDGAGNVIITSNSDQKTRTWHVGDAVITIKMDNVNNFPGINEKDVMTWHGDWHNGTTNTTDYVDWKLETNDRRLSSGWAEKHGEHKVICVACKGGLTDSINGGCYNVTSKPGHWANYESDLANYNCASHKNTKEVKVSGKYTISCTPPSGTSQGSCSATWAWDTPTKVDYLVHWCGHDESSPLKDASGNSFTPCTYKKVVDQEAVEDDPETEDVNEAKAEVYHYEVDVPHKEVAASGAVTSIAAHTCNSSHSWVDVDTTTVAAQPLTYHITVTFINSYTDGAQKTSTPGGVYPEHSCCGPCCSHVLPAISDEWVQWISYGTVRISDIRVNKISRNYVEGQNDITLYNKNDKYLIGTVQEGDVNVFYNIATENTTYRNSLYNDAGGYTDKAAYTGRILIDGASLSGRLRYSVQSQQHDKVLWEELNQLNEVKRTSECDGQDSTSIKNGRSIGYTANYNPSPDGGLGHEEEWALGILYRRSNSKSDVYYNSYGVKEDDFNTNFTHASGWLTNSGDGMFNRAVIQLGGISKQHYSNSSIDDRDKATWEYNRFVERRTTVNDVALTTDTLILQGTRQGDKNILYKAVFSTGKTTEDDHDRDDDGLKIKLADVMIQNNGTYLYQGQGVDVDIPYSVKHDISSASSMIFGGYNGQGADDNLVNHAMLGGERITTVLDNNGSVYDVTMKHSDSKALVKGPLSYSLPVTKNDSMNPEDFKSSAALYERRIVRPSMSLRIGLLNIQIDPTMTNQLYETKKSTQTWFQIINYTEPNAKAADYDNTIGKEYFIANSTIGGAEVFAQEAYYYGTTSTGFLPPRYKVNDVIIHTPISSHNNFLLQDKEFFDQRIGTNLSNQYKNTSGCPGTSLLCEYSYLDCAYLEEKVLFNMAFDDVFTRIDNAGNVTTSKTFAVDTYGYITSIVETANYIVVPIKTGLVTKINPAGYGSGINVNGTYLNIPLKEIGANYITGTKIKLTVQGSFSANTSVFECGKVKATMQSNGIKITNGEAAYVFYFNNATSYHNYELTISYDSLADWTLKVDDTNVNKSVSSPAPSDINIQFNAEQWENTMKLGERCKLYHVQITHLPGTLTCTDGCYENRFECQKVANYLCDVPTKFTGSAMPHKYTASIEGTYLIELYDSKGNYQSQKIHLNKGESIYAYLGSKGYWSYSGTDKASVTKTGETYIDRKGGIEDGTVLNPPTTVLDKNSGTGSVKLTPGVYFIEAYGKAGTDSKGGQASGWLTVLNDTTYYYSVGDSSWINSTNSDTNANVFGGKGGTAGKPAVPGVMEFSYTGEVKSVDLVPGTYTLEVWGAEGGGSRLSGNSYSGLGGLGGYSKGTLTLTENKTLYIAVGGAGASSTSGVANGGWNGGGSGYASSEGEPGNGGGGATHIAYKTGVLSSLASSKNDVIIVAGGGGGGGEDPGDSYGHGGGTSGSAGFYPGTQTSAGNGGGFGYGGGTFYGDGGGGGGGYYGGGTVSTSSFGSDTQGGGGGSGYIGGVTGGITTSGANTGNGKAKITGAGTPAVPASPAVTSYYNNVQNGLTVENVSDTGRIRILRYVDASDKDYVKNITYTASNTTISPLATPQVVLEKTSGSGSTSLTPGIYYIEAAGQAGTASKGGAASGWLLVKSTGTYYYSVDGTTWINITNTSNNALALAGKGGITGVPATHTHTSSCNISYTNYRTYSFAGSTAISCYAEYSSSNCDYCGFSDSYTSYYTDSTRSVLLFTNGYDAPSCSCPSQINGTQVWHTSSGSYNTTVYAEKTYSCNNLPLNVPGTTAVSAVVSGTSNLTYGTATDNVSATQYLKITKYVDLSSIAASDIPDDLISRMIDNGASGSTQETVIGEYGYTNNIQPVTLTPGEYLLEVWGAEGGRSYNNTQANYGMPGLGGYSKGTYTLNTTTTLFIAVGGKGVGNSGASTGGYNGGGNGYDSSGGSGGGATHIATANGLLSSLSSNKSAVLIVAGGGGGTEYDAQPSTSRSGAGGGTVGGRGLGNQGGYDDCAGYGGTQTAGGSIGSAASGGNPGSFGQGGHSTTWHSGAGGGGYYGGASGNSNGGGGGGSGYIGGVENGVTTAGVNSGNGKAKITRMRSSVEPKPVTINTIKDIKIETLVEVQVPMEFTNYIYSADTSKIIMSNAGEAPIVLEYTGNVQSVTLEPGTYKLEAWGASGGGDSSMAGEGGYTSGTVTFDKTTTLYVYVGQAGTRKVSGDPATATFNGGGDGGTQYMGQQTDHMGGSGGGATDIRVKDGLWYNLDSLKSRILVAGGGGGMGCASSHNKGNGGGLTGATTLNTGYYFGASSTGGTQTTGGYGNGQFTINGVVHSAPRAAGSFGIGANAAQCAAGGGGGYYGGGSNYTAGGAGGSSYVSGYAGCDTTYLANQKLNGKNLTFTDVVMQQGGNIGNGRVKITKVGSATKYETKASDGYTWVKVFSHDTNGGYFTGQSEALHTGKPSSAKYSILDEIDNLRTSMDSKYVFMLYYPETGQTNIWKQSHKPQDESIADGNGTKKVRGYEAVSIDMAGNFWGGLAKSTSGSTFIDGSINHGNWFYAIGSYSQWGTGAHTIPGGNNESINKVELWLATDINKVKASSTSGDHIINSTVTVTTGVNCPEESPYYWFNLAARTNVAQIRLIHDTHTAECLKEVNTLNYHEHTTDCIGGTPAYNYLLYAVQNSLPELNRLCKTYLGVSSASLGSTNTAVYNVIRNKQFDFSKVPAEIDGHDNPILNCYNHNTTHVHTNICRNTNKVTICNNIHHQGKHYDFGHPICYEPCNDNERHNPTKVNIDGTQHYIGSTMNLNGYFTVYWDNIGDFGDTYDKGSLVPSSEKGQGYENGMDTTRWLKRKVIIFDEIDVLFYDETQDTWTLHKAGTEINLPIVTDGIVGNGDDDEKRNWRDKNQQPITVYPFYCLLNNNEYERTSFQAWTEALNSPSSDGQGDRPYDKLREMHKDMTAKDTNFKRNNVLFNFTALHSTRQYHLFDVVGQIGNLLITYTTDPRWSNFFKQADPSSGWLMENILYEVVDDVQERYLYIGRDDGGIKDIRNHTVSAQNLFFDTWNTENWKHTAIPINSILEPDLLAKQTNYVWSKLATELKCGYDVYCEISTTGDYRQIEVDYKYFVFDTYTGEVSDVDLWSKVDSSYLAYYLADEDATRIQSIIDNDSLQGYYGIESVNSLALYHLYVDLSTEQKLRMITPEQMITSTTLSANLDGRYVQQDMWIVDPETGEGSWQPVSTWVPGSGPSLERVNIGTAYGIKSDYRTRILVGSPYDNWGLRDYSRGLSRYTYPKRIMDTNLGGQINANDFTSQARRWMFTAGIAENTVAVKYYGGDHVDLTTQSTHEYVIEDYDRYALLIGVNIRAKGDVWHLEYEAFPNSQRVLGVNLDTKYPDIIAVYGLSSKEDDFDVEQSH